MRFVVLLPLWLVFVLVPVIVTCRLVALLACLVAQVTHFAWRNAWRLLRSRAS